MDCFVSFEDNDAFFSSQKFAIYKEYQFVETFQNDLDDFEGSCQYLWTGH